MIPVRQKLFRPVISSWTFCVLFWVAVPALAQAAPLNFKTLLSTGTANTAVVNPSTRQVVVLTQASLQLHDDQGQVLKTQLLPPDTYQTLVWADEGQTAMALGLRGFFEWNLKTGASRQVQFDVPWEDMSVLAVEVTSNQLHVGTAFQVVRYNRTTGKTEFQMTAVPEDEGFMAGAITFSRDGNRMASADDLGNVWLFDQKGRVLWAHHPAKPAHMRTTKLQFLPGNQNLLVADLVQWQVLSLQNGKVQQQLTASSEPALKGFPLAFTEQKGQLVTFNQNSKTVWSLSPLKVLSQIPLKRQAGEAERATDASQLVVIDDEGARLLDWHTGTVKALQETTTKPAVAEFIEGGARLAVAFNTHSSITLFDGVSLKPTEKVLLPQHIREPVDDLQYHPVNQQLLMNFFSQGPALWSPVTGKWTSPDLPEVQKMTLNPQGDLIYGQLKRDALTDCIWTLDKKKLGCASGLFRISPDGKQVIQWSPDAYTLMDRSFKNPLTFPLPIEAYAVGFLSNSTLLALHPEGGVLLDALTGKVLGTYKTKGFLAWEFGVHEDLLVLGGQNHLRVFSLRTGKVLQDLQTHGDAIDKLEFNAEGTSLLVTDTQGVIEVFSVAQ